MTNGPGSANLFIRNLTNNAGATSDNYRELASQDSAVNHGNINVFAGNLSTGPFTNASTGRITLRSGTYLAVSGELMNQGMILLDCGVPIFGGPITGNHSSKGGVGQPKAGQQFTPIKRHRFDQTVTAVSASVGMGVGMMVQAVKSA
ncbi:MAG: hypothetical protein R3E79_46720 [Caldilineaceae bacterium]